MPASNDIRQIIHPLPRGSTQLRFPEMHSRRLISVRVANGDLCFQRLRLRPNSKDQLCIDYSSVNPVMTSQQPGISFGKAIMRLTCDVIMSPLVLLYRVHRRIAGADQAFPGWSQAVSLIPGKLGVYLRFSFYTGVLDRCDRDAHVGFGTLFSAPSLTIGQSAYIGNYCSIGDVSIANDVLIASHVSIMNGCRQHGIARLDLPVREQPGQYTPISIGCDSWIGERATVAANVGRHCVVGAGSLVLEPVPDYAIVVGVPARIIRDRRELCRGTSGDVHSPTTPIEPEFSNEQSF